LPDRVPRPEPLAGRGTLGDVRADVPPGSRRAAGPTRTSPGRRCSRGSGASRAAGSGADGRALDLAVRYEWTDRNAAKNARPPHPRKREPDPPSPEQAARLLNLVWAEDEEFGIYLWTAFTTGARRGEVTALRENRFDFTHQRVRVSASYIVKQGNRIEKRPKAGDGALAVAGPAYL
jgi:integrase